MTKHPEQTTNQYMIRKHSESLKIWIEDLFRDYRVRDLSPFRIEYYRAQLATFESYCRAHDVIQVPEMTANLLRAYL